MAKRRKPGAGRKPKPDKKVLLTIRVLPHVLEELKVQAQTWQGGNGNVSAFAESLMNKGLRERAEKRRDPAMKALCFVLAETAHQVVGLHVINEERNSERALFDWRWTPFFYRAFKLAVGQILDALEPKGEIERPDIRLSLSAQSEEAKLEEEKGPDSAASRYLRSWETPEARANYAADYILNYALGTIPHYSAEERAQERRRLDSMDTPSAWREFYGMPDAARDLTIKARDKGGKSR